MDVGGATALTREGEFCAGAGSAASSPSDSKSVLFIEILSKLNHAKNPTEHANSPLARTQSAVKDEKV